MASEMINIDGSQGEGGGQILRTSLALSMITGRPFRIEQIRARRPKPVLLRQHLTAVNAATEICGGNVDGSSIGSTLLTFTPGRVKAGDYTFSVGSAGSTTLVLQAVLPALLNASGPSTITLEGGTHNPHAPPLDFLEQAFLPLINRMGPTVSLAMERAGFYPAGGGRFIVTIEPSAKLSPIHLLQRGPVQRRIANASVAGLPVTIAKRELEQVEKMLGWSGDELQVRELPREWGPGNVMTLEVHSEHVTEVFTGFGMKGVSAESVAEGAARQAKQYLDDEVPVAECLADQLLIPIALAGEGSFRTQRLSMHTRTNIEIIQKFLPVRFDAKEDGRDQVAVRIDR